MRTPRMAFLFFFCIIPLSLSCSHIKSNHDYDPEIDYSSFKTYAWMPDQPQGKTKILHTNKLLLGRIQNAVDSDLASKGIRKVPLADASFMIRSLIGVDEDLDMSSDAYNHTSRTPYPAKDNRSSRRKRYDEGTLILDFVEAGDERLIWRGTGQSRLKKNTTPDARDKNIREVVDKILSHYPPAPSD